MNLRQIRELVRLLESSSLTVLEIEEADLRVRLEKGQTTGFAQPVPAALPQAVPAALPVETAPDPAPVATAYRSADLAVLFGDGLLP